MGVEDHLFFKTLSIHIHGGKLVVYILKICPSPIVINPREEKIKGFCITGNLDFMF